MKAIKTILFIGIISFAFYSFSSITQEKWVVPAKYENMKNPTDSSVDLDIGKSLYKKHCQSCHGKEGYGDGPKAEEQSGDLGDFSSAIGFNHETSQIKGTRGYMAPEIEQTQFKN